MFVLLEHANRAGTHWDLLVEVAGCDGLAGWRLAENPLVASGEIALERMPDHRRLYLDYEGEISGGRGIVRRLDRGDAEWRDSSLPRMCLKLFGTLLRGIAIISMIDELHGTLRMSSPEA